MRITTRKTLDRAFTGTGWFATALLVVSLLIVLVPIVVRGAGAFIFKETVENRALFLEEFNRGNPQAVEAERELAAAARAPVFQAIAELEGQIVVQPLEDAAGEAYRNYLDGLSEESPDYSAKADAARSIRNSFTDILDSEDNEEARALGLALVQSPLRAGLAGTPMETVFTMAEEYLEVIQHTDLPKREALVAELTEVKAYMRKLLGPFPGEPDPILTRDRYGEVRWDRAQQVARRILYREEYSEVTASGMLAAVEKPRLEVFAGTPVEPVFGIIENDLHHLVRPRWTFYWRFLTDSSLDAHFYGGIWPSLLGTFYLTVGAMLFAIPFGVVAAVYLTEYARGGLVVRIIRSCIDTLAAVPSIVFGLFGLAFFINALSVSPSKSVLAGAFTLALLILPTIIRAAEEAIYAVPRSYREASLGLGASKGRCVTTVVLPAALPGILTGIVISMGRAAGETAPIIFTAAVSVGLPLKVWETLSKPSPALPWTIYNLATEHQRVNEIRHVQYGMVLVLVVLVLLLNAAAIYLRARISRKLRA